MARYGSGSVPIATGWKCTNCRRTHRSSIPRSASGNTRARPALTTDTSRPPRNWSAPCPGSSERCNTILSQSDPICFLFADRYVPLIMRGCIENISQALELARSLSDVQSFTRIVLQISRSLYVAGLYAFSLSCWETLRSFDRVLTDSQLRAEAAEVFASGTVYAYIRNEKGDIAYNFLLESLPALESPLNLRGLCIVHQRLGIIARKIMPDSTLATSRRHLEKARDYARELIAQVSGDKTLARTLHTHDAT